MYADDTILYSSNLNTLQYNLSKTANWCDQNILRLNTAKTNWMTFTSKGTSHLYQDLQLTINDVQLNKVKQVKYLGLTLDSALAFQDHISVITKQIGNQIYQLSKIRRFLNINAALCIYKTTILPLFDYADIAYEQNLQTVNNKLQVLQNKSLRLIYNTPIDYRNLNNRVTTEELHDRAALITLQNRRDAHALFYAYDLAQLPVWQDQRLINTRRHQGIRLKVTRPKLPIIYRSIEYRAVKLWNNLKEHYTRIPTKITFKKQITGDLLKKCNIWN